MRPAGVVGTALCLVLAGCAGMVKGVDVPIPPPEVPTRLVIAGLSSADPRVRAKSAWALAGAKDMQAEAVAALEPLQVDPVKAVRYSAVWALGHIKGSAFASPNGAEGGTPPRPLSQAPPANPQEAFAKPNGAEGSTPPRPLSQAPPAYPQEAFARGFGGTVIVEMLIGEHGEVAHATIRRSIKEFDDAALACVRGWTFEPARVSGVPRATLAQAPITFRFY